MSETPSTEKDALLLRALRYAQSHAVTERARGRYSEERNWLDMCALLEPCVTSPAETREARP